MAKVVVMFDWRKTDWKIILFFPATIWSTSNILDLRRRTKPTWASRCLWGSCGASRTSTTATTSTRATAASFTSTSPSTWRRPTPNGGCWGFVNNFGSKSFTSRRSDLSSPTASSRPLKNGWKEGKTLIYVLGNNNVRLMEARQVGNSKINNFIVALFTVLICRSKNTILINRASFIRAAKPMSTIPMKSSAEQINENVICCNLKNKTAKLDNFTLPGPFVKV